VAEHHGCDRREVGRAAGRIVEYERHLPEVVGAEDAWGDDRERPGIDLVTVVEPGDDTARNAEQLAGPTSIGVPSSVQVSTPSSP
jgi:hypothetical protein